MWCGVTGEAERTVDHTANAQYTPLIFGCCVCLWGFLMLKIFQWLIKWFPPVQNLLISQ